MGVGPSQEWSEWRADLEQDITDGTVPDGATVQFRGWNVYFTRDLGNFFAPAWACSDRVPDGECESVLGLGGGGALHGLLEPAAADVDKAPTFTLKLCNASACTAKDASDPCTFGLRMDFDKQPKNMQCSSSPAYDHICYLAQSATGDVCKDSSGGSFATFTAPRATVVHSFYSDTAKSLQGGGDGQGLGFYLTPVASRQDKVGSAGRQHFGAKAQPGMAQLSTSTDWGSLFHYRYKRAPPKGKASGQSTFIIVIACVVVLGVVLLFATARPRGGGGDAGDGDALEPGGLPGAGLPPPHLLAHA